MAPDILDRSYTEKCDIWSIGVIVYMMFSQGQFPFDANGEVKLYKTICKGKFYLPSNKTWNDEDGQWVAMSEEAKDFVTQLLTLNPKKRPSAE